MESEITHIQQLIERIFTDTIDYMPRFIGALILLFVGWKLTNIFIRIISKRSNKRKIDKTISRFMVDLLSWTLKIIILISSAAIMGVQTASFLTLLGTAGIAIGLALQGTLANVAGGVLILILRPFKIGDLIETKEHIGYVKYIQLFTTEITTFQNEVVIIPNAQLSNERIKNYSKLGKIRIDIEIGVSYNSDIQVAINTLTEMIQEESIILKTPNPYVGVLSYGDSSINLSIRFWTLPNNYWESYFAVMNNCKGALDKANIEIPFPQTVVHLKNS